MLIRDFLAPYWEDSERLTNAMQILASANPAYQLLTEFARRCDGGESAKLITAEGLVMACRGLGLATVSQVVSFADIAKDSQPEQFMTDLGLSQRPLLAMKEYGSHPEITASQLISRYRDQCLIADDIVGANWSGKLTEDFHDKKYPLVSRDALLEILNKAPLPVRGYEEEKADCDDYSRCVRGYTSRWSIGNVALGAADILMLNEKDSITEKHAILIAALTDGSIVLCEPQTKQIVPMDYCFPPAVRNCLIKLVF